jgi:hypothetical protein
MIPGAGSAITECPITGLDMTRILLTLSLGLAAIAPAAGKPDIRPEKGHRDSGQLDRAILSHREKLRTLEVLAPKWDASLSALREMLQELKSELRAMEFARVIGRPFTVRRP